MKDMKRHATAARHSGPPPPPPASDTGARAVRMCGQVPLRLHILVHTPNAALLMAAAVAACHARCASAQCALLYVVAQLATGVLLPTLALACAQRASARLSAQLLD